MTATSNWKCRCGAFLRMSQRNCPNCRAMIVYDPDSGFLRNATARDMPRLCTNRDTNKLRCNWLSYAEGLTCYACELTDTIPVQSKKQNRAALRRFEEAKRRLVYALMRMQLLPLYGITSSGYKLCFHLKEDQRDNPLVIAENIVMTGHMHGNITLNIRETDRVTVEVTKRQFGERYRTLLGTLRHEVGHYFFCAIVEGNPQLLEEFRELFGDEREDYGKALEAYHQAHDGELLRRRPPQNYISKYAQSHPHEDWAETWAHYLHMEDALAVSSCLGLDYEIDDDSGKDEFTLMNEQWERLTVFANSINLSMGHDPAYPFKLTKEVLAKMRFVSLAIDQSGAKPFAYRFLRPDDSTVLKQNNKIRSA